MENQEKQNSNNKTSSVGIDIVGGIVGLIICYFIFKPLFFPTNHYIGTWKDESGFYELKLNKDKTGTLNGEDITYDYNTNPSLWLMAPKTDDIMCYPNSSHDKMECGDISFYKED